MATAKLYTSDGAEGAAVTLNESIFDVPANKPLVHQVSVALMNAKRQGNAETKTRHEVRGGGAKPFRQKGTGRARQGSLREPQMRGGGTVFGPHKRSYRQKTPQKMKQNALRCVLSERARTEKLSVLEGLPADLQKTKPMAEMVGRLTPDGRRTLLVTAQNEKSAVLSGRNLPRLSITTAADVNVLDVLRAVNVVILKDALEPLEARLT